MLLTRATCRVSTPRLYHPDCLETVTLQSMTSNGTEIIDGEVIEAAAVQTDYTVNRVRRWRNTQEGEILDSEHELTSRNHQRFTFWRKYLDAANAPNPKIQDSVVDSTGWEYKITKVAVEQLYQTVVNVDCLQVEKPT